jgi:hypothetical protein
VTGGVLGSGCTFSFTLQFVSNPSISTFQIGSSGGSGTGFFAGHMASMNNSGYAGQPVVIPASEPSWTVLVLGACIAATCRLLHRTP